MGKFIHIDIMMKERFLCTLHMPHCQAFKLTLREVKDFIEKKRPSLIGKAYEVYIS